MPVVRLDPDLPLPAYAHPGDAGADLVTAVDVTLRPGERALVPTGIAMAVPEGYVALVHPRSGLAARHGLSIVNTPGTIDAGYRGEVKVLLVNLDPAEPIELRRGDRVAQLVFQRVEQAAFTEVEVLPESVRGEAATVLLEASGPQTRPANQGANAREVPPQGAVRRRRRRRRRRRPRRGGGGRRRGPARGRPVRLRGAAGPRRSSASTSARS